MPALRQVLPHCILHTTRSVQQGGGVISVFTNEDKGSVTLSNLPEIGR